MGQAVVDAARGWIGTRFHHQGRLKQCAGQRGGVDCLGLLVGVAGELGLKDKHQHAWLTQCDECDYGHIPDGRKLEARLAELLDEVVDGSRKAGDVLLMRFDREPQHLAIVSDHPQGGFGIIHAYAAARRVVEQRLDALWAARIVAVYRISNA